MKSKKILSMTVAAILVLCVGAAGADTMLVPRTTKSPVMQSPAVSNEAGYEPEPEETITPEADAEVEIPLMTAAPIALKAPHPFDPACGLSLPIDFSGGKKPADENFTSPTTYEDPSIKVTITTGRENSCDYWIAEIWIADASQLRTVAADPDLGFDGEMETLAVNMANRVDAVVALNGDFFYYTRRGYIMRQGTLFLDNLKGGRDVLLVDEEGDFHVIPKAPTGSVTGEIDGKKIINAFFFGPILYNDGVLGTNFNYNDMLWNEGTQRIAICQVDHLHYKVICCASAARGSIGMKLDAFAKFVAKQGVRVAYNLDGGNSTCLIFRGEKVNDVNNPKTRKVADIIYFASAYDGSAN